MEKNKGFLANTTLLYASTSISSRKNINLFPYVQVENPTGVSQVFDQSVGKTLGDCFSY